MQILQYFSAVPLAQAAQRTGWEGWPFQSPDGGFSLTASVARVLFVLVVFGLLAWILRRLFGPGGPMRPAEFGTGHIAEREQRREALRGLRARHKAGELSDAEFAERSRELEER